MTRVLGAGAGYFAIVFAAGFVLGAVRVLLLEPTVGELGATLLEVPVMLLLSWVACGWILDRLRVPPARSSRLLMGGVAFGLLMAAELALSVLLFDRTGTQMLEGWQSTVGAVGLAGQLAFALIPVLRR